MYQLGLLQNMDKSQIINHFWPSFSKSFTNFVDFRNRGNEIYEKYPLKCKYYFLQANYDEFSSPS